MFINHFECSLKKLSNFQWVFQFYLYTHIEIDIYLEPLQNKDNFKEIFDQHVCFTKEIPYTTSEYICLINSFISLHLHYMYV